MHAEEDKKLCGYGRVTSKKTSDYFRKTVAGSDNPEVSQSMLINRDFSIKISVSKVQLPIKIMPIKKA